MIIFEMCSSFLVVVSSEFVSSSAWEKKFISVVVWMFSWSFILMFS
jgi:hypothetical protein